MNFSHFLLLLHLYPVKYLGSITDHAVKFLCLQFKCVFHFLFFKSLNLYFVKDLKSLRSIGACLVRPYNPFNHYTPPSFCSFPLVQFTVHLEASSHGSYSSLGSAVFRCSNPKCFAVWIQML